MTGLEDLYPRPLSGHIVTTPPPALVPPRSVIEGQHVVLEPLNPAEHCSALYVASHSSEEALHIWDYMKVGPWAEEAAYLAYVRQLSSSFDPVAYVVRSKETDRVCGQITFLDIHPETGVIEIGNIWFAPELQRTRAATEALFLMIKQAMDDLGYRRMQWRCNALNKKSRQAARRLGFRFEGIFYNDTIAKGRNRDTAWYSILDSEWPELRGIIESWLADDNFDDNDKQKQSLLEMTVSREPTERRMLEDV